MLAIQFDEFFTGPQLRRSILKVRRSVSRISPLLLLTCYANHRSTLAVRTEDRVGKTCLFDGHFFNPFISFVRSQLGLKKVDAILFCVGRHGKGGGRLVIKLPSVRHSTKDRTVLNVVIYCRFGFYKNDIMIMIVTKDVVVDEQF